MTRAAIIGVTGRMGLALDSFLFNNEAHFPFILAAILARMNDLTDSQPRIRFARPKEYNSSSEFLH